VTSPFQALIVASGLIVLHAPDGHEVFVNPQEITVLHQRLVPGESHFTEKATCLINTTDGKFITIVEDCFSVLDAIKQTQHP
jgi:hypothetical protein